MEGEGAGFAVDGDGQLGAEMSVFDDAVVEAGAAEVEGAEDLAEGGPVDFEAWCAGAEGAEEGGDDGGGHGALGEHHLHRM